jgi:hypothetical protein
MSTPVPNSQPLPDSEHTQPIGKTWRPDDKLFTHIHVGDKKCSGGQLLNGICTYSQPIRIPGGCSINQTQAPGVSNAPLVLLVVGLVIGLACIGRKQRMPKIALV